MYSIPTDTHSRSFIRVEPIAPQLPADRGMGKEKANELGLEVSAKGLSRGAALARAQILRRVRRGAWRLIPEPAKQDREGRS